MATAVVDVPLVSAFCSIPQTTINNLRDAPTRELVDSLLAQVAAKAREFEDVKAEKLRLEVELENAVRGGETKARALKSSVDKALKEAADLRAKLKAEEDTRLALDTELQTLKSASSTSLTEVTDLRSRISSLESANRDTVALLEAKSTAHDRLAEELSAQHQKTLQLRRNVSELEQAIQQANSAATSTKYREQSLQQEIDSLKRTNDWYETELKTKSAEYLKYRKDKGARITELQRLNEDANSTIEALRRTEVTLRNRLEEVGQKANEALEKIQRMQDDAAKTEEAFRAELDSANRLAELQKASADTAKRRMHDLVSSLEETRAEAADEIGRIRAEMETEHSDREAAERQVVELEDKVASLEAQVQNQPSMPATPHRAVNGTGFNTPSRAGSPFSAGGSRSKGALTITQMYSEYTTVKAQLEAEKRRSAKLSGTIDEMINDLETNRPEIENLRADHARLESEVTEMSKLLDEVGKERDTLRKDARKWEGKVGGLTKEGEILRQQLRDLSTQIKVLLMEIHLRDQGVHGLSAADQLAMGRLARGEEDDSAGGSDTDRFISQHLATFKNVQELQEQNTKLIRLTRELGQKMDGDEAREKQNQQAQEHEELESLREKVERYKDEMKSMVTQSQSFIRERDMFRRMLAHRGQLPPGADLNAVFGQSVDGGAAPSTPSPGRVMNSIEQSPGSKDLADYAKLLKEMQTHFDSYRSEAAADRIALKQQLDSVSKKNSELQSEAARSSSQLSLAHERYEMLQANYAMLRTENQELQRRSQTLGENAAKQDMRTQQVAEDLVEAKGLLDSMRNENANLKAEKEFWKTVERRLTEENENLSNEKARLNTLNSNLQNLINEREHSESETRRRLRGQVDSLEAELQTTKRRLDSEIEDGKKSALRREYENEQSQKRIEDLVTSLGTFREELVAAKTTRDHLQARVNELTVELQSAEERVQVLKIKPTAGPADQEMPEATESSITREQELEVEVSELKRDLQLARGELETAKEQVEQYKGISQSSEEELQSMNETHDQYRAEMDRIVEEKDGKIRELEQRVEDITSELSARNTELSALQDEQNEASRRLEEQKTMFEADIARLKDEGEHHAAAAHFHEQDLKVQAEIAQQAQQNYENELVKHAEAAKALQKVRKDFNELMLDVAEARTDAETAKANLARSEESWAETKERFERELSDLRRRREEVNTQNKILHQQLESVSAQISALQQKRTEQFEDGDAVMTPTSSAENLQEVIRYLRREKEIVDVQYELSVQEAKRLKQRLDHTQAQLDETRLKLDQQRRSEGESERNALNHQKLIETINELNVFRESSVTLRNEARQAQHSLAEKTKRVEELTEEIQPLQARIRELENQKEVQEGEMRLLQEDRDRWQQRTQNILQKYDRVDPAELESLKEQITTLEKERDELATEKEHLQEQVNGIPERLKSVEEEASQRWQHQRERLVEQFKSRSRELTAKVKEGNDALQAANREREQLEQQLGNLNGELDAAKAERDRAIARAEQPVRNHDDQAQDSAMSDGVEEGQVDEQKESGATEGRIKALEEQLQSSEQNALQHQSRAESLQNELRVCQARIAELEQRVIELQSKLDEATTQLAQLRAEQQQSSQSQTVESEADMESLRQELLQSQQEIERLRADVSINAAINNEPAADGTKSIAEQITEQVEAIRAELESRHATRVQQLETQYQTRADIMKNQLSKKLAEGKEQYRKAIDDEYQARTKKLQAEHQEELARLQAQHREEMEVLRQNEDSRFEQFKQTYISEHPSGATTVEENNASQAPASQEPWHPSESQVRELIANNATVKEIIQRNLRSRLEKEREALVTKLREEQDKVAAERAANAEEKATKDRESAVQMEGKKYIAKMSMAENRARTAIVKIEVVQKAAEETPQRPVGEVWAIAKNARPMPVAAPQQGNGPQQSTSPTLTFGQPTPVPVPNQQSVPSAWAPPSSFAHIQPLGALGGAQLPRPGTATGVSNQGFAMQSTTTTEADQTQQAGQPQQLVTLGQPNMDLPAKPAVPTLQSNHANAGAAFGAVRGLLSAIPRGAGQGGRAPRGGRGGGQQQNQGLQSVHAPNQSNVGRGTGIPRGASNIGRGRGGQGRGGVQQVQAGAQPQGQGQGQNQNQNQNQAQAQRSPGGARGGGALNAAATQFVPVGNKRVRDEGQEGGEANGGKRVKSEQGVS